MNATGVSLDIARELKAICGEEYVREATEKSQSIVVQPSNADEVAAILRLANAVGFTVAPFGGQTTLGAPRARTDVMLLTGRLTEVEHYDPADLTVGVGAGMTVAQLNALIADGKLMFACDPPFPQQSSIGGVLASAKHGPLRQGYGGVRDFCIGIRFVTGDGRKAKAGGHVVKNVAGYDLMKLLIGSYGTLAVITSASFKLFPAPRQTRTFLAEFATWQEALKFRNLVVRSPLSPICLEIVSPAARKMMRPEMTDDAWVICVRAAGSDAVLARYRKELGSAVTRDLEGEGERVMWHAVEQFPFGDNSAQDSRYRIHTLFTPPAELGPVLQALDDVAKHWNATTLCIGRVGLGHLRIAEHITDSTSPGQLLADLAAPLPKSAKMVSDWQALDAMPSMRAIKQALDANNILRGRELF